MHYGENQPVNKPIAPCELLILPALPLEEYSECWLQPLSAMGKREDPSNSSFDV